MIMEISLSAVLLIAGIAVAAAFRLGKHCGAEAMRRSVNKVLALTLTEECTCGLWRTKEIRS